MFANLRRSIEDLLNRAIAPEDRRLAAARMRETLVQAKMGLDEMRDALAASRRRLEAEQREVATMQRRRRLAEQAGDAETLRLAVRFETLHAERADVVARKVAAQEAELELAEREVAEMTKELRAALHGAGAGGSAGPARVETPLDEDERLASELEALGRSTARADREAAAERRLDELKRRMGK